MSWAKTRCPRPRHLAFSNHAVHQRRNCLAERNVRGCCDKTVALTQRPCAPRKTRRYCVAPADGGRPSSRQGKSDESVFAMRTQTRMGPPRPVPPLRPVSCHAEPPTTGRLACLLSGYTDHSRQRGLKPVVQPRAGPSRCDNHGAAPSPKPVSTMAVIFGSLIACAKASPAPVRISLRQSMQRRALRQPDDAHTEPAGLARNRLITFLPLLPVTLLGLRHKNCAKSQGYLQAPFRPADCSNCLQHGVSHHRIPAGRQPLRAPH